jgi:sugar O-acyltransferase (sialic acid O-acetyltransferase NeuD family)
MHIEFSFIGAGGHFETVADSFLSGNKSPDMYEITLYDDSKRSRVVGGLEIKCRSVKEAKNNVDRLHISIGDNLSREAYYQCFSAETEAFFSVIDETAILSQSATVGHMVFLAKGAILEAKTTIGDGVIVNTGAVICHGSDLGKFCHLAPNSTVCGDCVIGERTLIGAGATVLPGVKIGSDCIIGAGAVVTKDVTDNAVLYSENVRGIVLRSI